MSFHATIKAINVSHGLDHEAMYPFWLQTAQLCKSSFVQPATEDMQDQQNGAYHPTKHHNCTVYAGTNVQQVQISSIGRACCCMYVCRCFDSW